VKPVIIHREAIEELDEAVAYYEDQKAGLGSNFLVEVEQALSKIQQNPSLGSVYKVIGIRRYVRVHPTFANGYKRPDVNL
jgi:toxin ParE1/3/4